MFIFGTVQNYIGTLKLQQKWKMKQQGLEMPTNGGAMAAIQQMQKEQKSATLSTITSKLKSGKKLSAGEMEFLRTNDHALYEKAVKIAKEREEYRDELRKCKTKDDVDRVHTLKMSQFASEIKSVGSSGMSSGEKAAAYEDISMRQMGVEDEHNIFVRSTSYSKLKWEHEIKKAEMDEQKAAEELFEKKKADAKPVEDPEKAKGPGETEEPGKPEDAPETPKTEKSDGKGSAIHADLYAPSIIGKNFAAAMAAAGKPMAEPAKETEAPAADKETVRGRGKRKGYSARV